MEKIINLLKELDKSDSIVKIVFSDLRKKSDPCKKVAIRPLVLHGKLCYQAENHQEKKVTHENIERERLTELCSILISENFKQINIFSKTSDYQILASKPENPKIIKKEATKELKSLEHNKTKQYIISDKEPCDFLIRLGVMDANGQVNKKHYAKFRQINRFLEIVKDTIDDLLSNQGNEKNNEKSENKIHNKSPIKIIDFGCGKAYLTFALYYYLKVLLNRNVEIIGLDLKEDVIEFCNNVAKDLKYEHLKFQIGDIAQYQDANSADMVVTLHACDTATDYALIKAVAWNAKVILSVPCCQHELFDQIKNDLHTPIFKHGILNERFCAILTDGLRALKLEEQGYDVSLVEFTSLEHTSKNIMIRAVKIGKKKPAARAEYEKIKEYWQVNPTIDQLGL